MARNVTDAAVLLGALTGIDPDDPATAGQAGHAVTDYTPFLDDEALEGARIGVWREGTVLAEDPDDPRIAATQAVMADAIDALTPRARRRRRCRHRHRAGRCETSSFAAGVRVQDGYRDVPRDVYRRRYPKTLADLIAFNEANPDLEGDEFLEQPDLGGRRGDRRTGRSRMRPHARAASTPAAQAAIDDADGRARSRRDRRADQRPGVADQPGTRPATTSRCSSARRPRPPSRARRASPCPRATRRRAAHRRVVHRRCLGRAGPHRIRLRLRAGDAGPGASSFLPTIGD